ncbi:SMC-Scp complex subunit ScpB [Portibacter lacus]|uniref:Segregation and condensation protein B n=1 Tax=Portibacter lacus TaxID=1099794 RepID=A0AA37WE55_9BACT|nr:SMC-Scp complex subunit ScpB [Portibacter lacus]GLR18566.1 segregation and condensation protein B [Portibacter lacus]
MDRLDLHVESLIFATDVPISAEMIKKCLDRLLVQDFDIGEIHQAIFRLTEKYNADSFAFGIDEIDGAFAFMSKPAYHATVGSLLKEKSNSKLTKVAMETLSIIAYKQPVTKTFIESIRGVNSDYTVQKLLEKELIELAGRAEGPGKPLLYRTSAKFMDYFGLKSAKDLPTLKEFNQSEETIGQPSSIEIVEEE